MFQNEKIENTDLIIAQHHGELYRILGCHRRMGLRLYSRYLSLDDRTVLSIQPICWNGLLPVMAW